MKIFKLTRYGETQHIGTSAESCYFKLQRSQSQSAQYAMKYGGWKIEEQEVEEEEYKTIAASDPWHEITATLAEDFNNGKNLVKIILPDGTEAKGETRAIKYSGTTKGSKVIIYQSYILR